jgi:hypothetical protein
MRILFGTQDTRSNDEDFALTPYLSLVVAKGYLFRVYGIAICWGFFSFYIGLGFNVPKSYPTFMHIPKGGNK